MGRMIEFFKKQGKSLLLTLIFVVARTIGLARRKLVIAPDGELYLTRWYLTPESHWWRDRFPAVFLHCFHASDPGRGFHSHPWIWAVSLILKGQYAEERPVLTGFGPDQLMHKGVEIRTFGPGDLNYIGQDDFHRVQLLTPKVWTVFVCGPLHGDSWEFLDEDGTLRPHGTETPGD
jgi:hypothetical protein